MDISKALSILDDAAEDAGMSMLDLLQYMSECDLDDTFSAEEIRAYRIAMRDFRKLFATAECV